MGKTEIFAIHGVADSPNPALFQHRNLLDTERFSQTLRSASRFIPLRTAIVNGGRALTIDDATIASGWSALLARRLGHAVTLFVNPWQVQDGRPYAFALLNLILDRTARTSAEFRDKTFDLTTNGGKAQLRAQVKEVFRQHTSPEQNYDLLQTVAEHLGSDQTNIPPHLHSLSVHDLQRLQHAGVDLENHYWTHLDPAAHTSTQFKADFQKSKRWLLEMFGVDSRFFASPFGEFQPSARQMKENSAVALLLDSLKPPGFIDEWTVNRVTLTTS